MFGSIVGGLIGGIGSYLGAKKQSKAIDRMNEMNNQYINAVMPDIRKNIDQTGKDYQAMRDRGAYSGDYFADPNAMQLEANQGLYDYGVRNRGLGQSIMDRAGGFVDNQGALYNAFSGMANRPDSMAAATRYATDNMNPIVKAMMRDDTRRLEEQTLPGINTAASGSGNVNSSRAGVASALAERAYGDRLADVSSNVFNNLRDASLRQGNTDFDQSLRALGSAANANSNLAQTFNMGNNMFGSAVNNSLTAGTNQNTWDQARMNADRDNYDYQTGYLYNLGKDYGGFLAGGSPGQGNYQMNAVSPTMAAIGGAMSGAGMGGGFGGFGGGGGGMMSYPTGGMGNFGGGMGMWT